MRAVYKEEIKNRKGLTRKIIRVNFLLKNWLIGRN